MTANRRNEPQVQKHTSDNKEIEPSSYAPLGMRMLPTTRLATDPAAIPAAINIGCDSFIAAAFKADIVRGVKKRRTKKAVMILSLIHI